MKILLCINKLALGLAVLAVSAAIGAALGSSFGYQRDFRSVIGQLVYEAMAKADQVVPVALAGIVALAVLCAANVVAAVKS